MLIDWLQVDMQGLNASDAALADLLINSFVLPHMRFFRSFIVRHLLAECPA